MKVDEGKLIALLLDLSKSVGGNEETLTGVRGKTPLEIKTERLLLLKPVFSINKTLCSR